jgi:hypothetical protein
VRWFKEDEAMNLENKIRREHNIMWKPLNLDELISVMEQRMQRNQLFDRASGSRKSSSSGSLKRSITEIWEIQCTEN